MEQEVRTIVKAEDFDRIISYFEAKASKKDLENQIIYDYHTEGDFRLVRTKNYVELNFRTNNKNNIVYIGKKYEKDLIDMFKNIGISIEFKRFRSRYKYIYEDLYITIDKNIKTGNILRAKFNYETEEEKETKLEKIDNLLGQLQIEKTSLDKFQEVYGKYRTSWSDLVGDINEEEFLK